MKKYTLSILGLSLLLSASVFNTSCSSENDAMLKTETRDATASNIETLDGSMWKQEGGPFDFYIQFNNGLFAGGPTTTNMVMVSKYFIEDGNIIIELETGGFNIMPYSFEDGKLIVIQNNYKEVYSYYGKATEISNDFTAFDMLYRSNWTQYKSNNSDLVLTVKFFDNGQLKYSYDEYSPWTPAFKLDKTGTYRIEKDKIYIDWNDGKGETAQYISIPNGMGTLILSYPEGSGKDEIKFYQS